MALVARVTRSSVRDELGREHVQTAVSRGIPFPLVLRRHVLRNAAIPITTIAGLTIASLIAISAVVERAFALNGLGAYLVEASLNKDFAVVQGISLVLVAAFVITNTIVDILYALLDPRVTLGSRSLVSVIAAGEAVAIRRRGIPGLRGTGWVGHVCAGVIVFALLIAVIGPHIAPYDPNFIQLRYAYVGPVGDHYLGFDGRGRDLLSRLLVRRADGRVRRGRRGRHLDRRRHRAGDRRGLARRLARQRHRLAARRPVRVPRHPASPSWPPPCSGRA